MLTDSWEKRSITVLKNAVDLLIDHPTKIHELSFEKLYQRVYMLTLKGSRERLVCFLVKTAQRAAHEIGSIDAFRLFGMRFLGVVYFADRVALAQRGFSMRALLRAARAMAVVDTHERAEAFALWRSRAAHACFKPGGVGFKRARTEFYLLNQ